MMFRIRHQRIGKVVCCNLLVGETEGTLRLAGSFILSNEEWAEFTLHPVTRLEANESCAALCVGPLDFVPPIERDRYALILEDKCYLTTLAFVCEQHDTGPSEFVSAYDTGALRDIRSALEPHRADRPTPSGETEWPAGVSARELPEYAGEPFTLSVITVPPKRKFKVTDRARVARLPVSAFLSDYITTAHIGAHVVIETVESNGLYRARFSTGGALFFADDDMLEKVT